MAFNLASYALGKHAFFFREGDPFTVPSAGTCGVSSKPDATDPAFIDFGPIVDWDHDFKPGKTEEVWGPQPGRLQLSDEVDIKVKMMLKFTVEQVSALPLEIFYRTTQKLTSAGGQFNPNSAQTRRGWLHIELYDQNDEFALSLDAWGRMRVTGGVAGKDGGLMKPTLEHTVYYSTLNTGLLNNS